MAKALLARRLLKLITMMVRVAVMGLESIKR
jgi:hypothetical protein